MCAQLLRYKRDINNKLFCQSWCRFQLHNVHTHVGQLFDVVLQEHPESKPEQYGLHEVVAIHTYRFLEVPEHLCYIDVDMSLISWRTMYRRLLSISNTDNPLLDCLILQGVAPFVVNKRTERNKALQV